MSDEEQINVAGVKVKAGGKIGKIFVWATAAVSIIGALYGGFEVYKDYTVMKTKIQTYTAPDLSGFDKRIAIIEKAYAKQIASIRNEVKTIQDSVVTASDHTRDIKNDLKSDLASIERTVDSVERRGKDAFKRVRESIEINDSKVREMITVNSDRFDTRREQIRKDMDALEQRVKKDLKDLKKDVDDKIKKALNNPLSKM
jgi:DNA anti-recombination protein RmuC